MSEELKIEKVKSENFESFLSLIDKLAEYEKSNPPDNAARKRLRQDALSNKPIFGAYLGKIKDEYVGYMIIFMTYSSYLALPILYLEDLYVLEKYRKKGIGQEMFDFCVKIAKEKGCGRMEWCAYNWNKTAISFYEKNNANRLDKTYYRLNKEQIDRFFNSKS